MLISNPYDDAHEVVITTVATDKRPNISTYLAYCRLFLCFSLYLLYITYIQLPLLEKSYYVVSVFLMNLSYKVTVFKPFIIPLGIKSLEQFFMAYHIHINKNAW